MRPGGTLAFDCGGGVCLSRVRDAIRAAGDDHNRYVNYQGIGSTSARLEKVGFDANLAEIVEAPWKAPTSIELQNIYGGRCCSPNYASAARRKPTFCARGRSAAS